MKSKKVKTKKKVVATVPRGYKVRTVNRTLTVDGESDLYELIEVSGTKVTKPRYFVDEESAHLFIERSEMTLNEVKALAGKNHAPVGMRSVIKETEELKSLAELIALSDNERKSDRAASKVMYSDSE